MSKKQHVEQHEKVIFGRPSNNLKMGIVGVPNVGKSTLFNAMTKLNVPASNFPFCTIEPNEARTGVPDERFDYLVEKMKPEKGSVGAALTVTDIAGLVKGASNGEGLGNAFLADIRGVDGIYHVVRIFEDEDVTHIEGTVDPLRDIACLIDEMRLKDIEVLEKAHETVSKKQRSSKDKKIKVELEVLEKMAAFLKEKEGRQIRFNNSPDGVCLWKTSEIEIINSHQPLTSKNMVFLINMSEKDFLRKKNKWLGKLKTWVDENCPGDPIVPFCGSLEAELASLIHLDESDPSSELAKNFCEENKFTSVMPRIIKIGYQSLDLIHFFTTISEQLKCWTVRKYTKAPQAGGVIHSDFEKAFIKAEVMKFDDFKEYGSDTAVKAAGKYKQQGKNYSVQDGDIILFKFGQVTSSTKAASKK